LLVVSCQLPANGAFPPQLATNNWQLTTIQGDRRGSNPRLPGPQPGALPTELRPPSDRFNLYLENRVCQRSGEAYGASCRAGPSRRAGSGDFPFSGFCLRKFPSLSDRASGMIASWREMSLDCCAPHPYRLAALHRQSCSAVPIMERVH
jgi:hypothetical protein